MGNDLDLNFKGDVISYSSSIFKGVKEINVEHDNFCIYKIYGFEIFAHVNLYSVSIHNELDNSKF